MHLQMPPSRSPYVFPSAPSPSKTMHPYHDHGRAGPAKFCYRQQTGDYGDHMGVAQLMGHEVYDREIGGGGEGGGRENLFEKPLTPSDVGKLNRLVIPKQHAKRYFPLNSRQPLEKGMQLSFFEDEEVGKVWQFRYSYWSSSQSYVLTKGWSRFVKEKRLVCGDVVLFQRDRVDGRERLYIGWRRRQPAQSSAAAVRAEIQWDPPFYTNHSPHPVHSAGGRIGGQQRHEALLHAGEPANSKRLRLFGVNLDCPIEQPDSPESNGSYLSEKGRSQLPFGGSSSQT